MPVSLGSWQRPSAKTLNALDETRGQVFERRYSAIEIVDDEALLDRIAYTVTNPAAANLVPTVEAWQGLCLWQGGDQDMDFSRVRNKEYERARAAAENSGDVDIEDFTDRYDAVVTPVEGELDERVEARLDMLAEKYRGKRPLGMKAVLAEDTSAAPNHPKRSPMPLCHASCPDTWRAFRQSWRAFEHAYRVASEIFRGGALGAVFPEHCFRPSMPLLV